MELQIKLARQIISIHARYDRVCHLCKNYIVPETTTPTITLNISEQDINTEHSIAKMSDSQSTDQFSEISLETNAVYRRIVESLIPFSTFLMHGSVVSDGTYSYMFTAPSGTGKTTRTNLFLKNIPNSYVINGDKPLLIIEKNTVLACGSPWCGKEGMNTNVIQPLCAIFFLERAEKTSITDLSFADAFPKIIEQSYIPLNPKLKLETMKLIHQLNNKVNFYHFNSSLDDDTVIQAWHKAKNDAQKIF